MRTLSSEEGIGKNVSVVLAGIVILLLAVPQLAISGYGQSPTNSGSTCSMANLEAQVIAAGQVVTSQEAINFAIASTGYLQNSAGFNVSYSGANDGWSYDSNCIVSWTGIAVNFLLQSANGSKYTLTVSENPKTSVVYGVQVSPAVSEAISPSCSSSCQWSGYAVAGNSGASQQVYESDADWYIPTLSLPPSGQISGCTSTNVCDLSEWVGLTDISSPTGSGTIVQAGIYSDIYPNLNPPPQNNMLYEGWTEVFCAGYSASWCQGSFVSCGALLTANPSDQMESTIENQYAYSGTSGNNYYIFLNDWTQSVLCYAQPNGNPVGIGNSQHPFTPYYAAFMGEENNHVNSHLADFSNWYFTLCAANFGSGYQGVYSNYNSGYGYGVYMKNGGYPNTQTTAMTSVGYGYGQFYVDWQQSTGT